MESIAVSTTTGVLNVLFGKLTEILGEKYKLAKGVRKDIESLESELRMMKVALHSTADAELDPLHKMWRDTLREMSYDMEDCIDISLQRISPTNDDVTNWAKMTRDITNMIRSHKIAPLIQELKALVVTERERKNMYNLDLSSNSPSASVKIDPRICALSGKTEMLVGIDDLTNKVISWLMPESDMDLPQQVMTLSIVGCAGLGKTTLANQVLLYLKIKGLFKCIAFVTVSQRPSVKDILTNICSQVNLPPREWANVDNQIRGLSEHLQGKRYCVVLDDIWEPDTWKSIGAALVKSSPGSIIIITTRIKDVAESCRSSHGGRVHEMDHLSDSDSRELFFTRIFECEENCPPELVQDSRKILSKCEGIPLAITFISGLLANATKSIYNWNKVKECILSRVPGNNCLGTMQSIFALSYFNLPHDLRGCLLYFSAFPEHSTIEKDRLVSRWIAEGLISARQGETIHEVGVEYFNMLVNRSLIKPCDEDNGEVMTCRVHDVILNFIVLKAAEENFVTLLDPFGLSRSPNASKVRRLLVQDGYADGGVVVPWKNIKPHVRSVSSSDMDCNDLCPLSKFKVLRVLDLEGCESLKNNHLARIKKLVLLRYLSIRKTNISDLPANIGRARHLEILDIRDTKVTKLPEGIVLLQRLVRLLVDTKVKFPTKGVSKMKALEELGRVSISLQPLSFIKELGELTKLRILDLQCDCKILSDKTYEYLNILASSLGVLGRHNLCSLIFEVCDVSDAFMVSLSRFPALEALRKLYIWDTLIVPNWLGSLVNLESLGFGAIKITQDGLRVLGGMSSLEALSLYKCHSQDRLIMNRSDGFRHLKFLSMEVPNMLFMPGSAPNLKDLRMDLNLGMDGCDDSGIQHLPSLTKVLVCIEGPDYSSIECKAAELRSILDAHPNRPVLIIETNGY